MNAVIINNPMPARKKYIGVFFFSALKTYPKVPMPPVINKYKATNIAKIFNAIINYYF